MYNAIEFYIDENAYNEHTIVENNHTQTMF